MRYHTHKEFPSGISRKLPECTKPLYRISLWWAALRSSTSAVWMFLLLLPLASIRRFPTYSLLVTLIELNVAGDFQVFLANNIFGSERAYFHIAVLTNNSILLRWIVLHYVMLLLHMLLDHKLSIKSKIHPWKGSSCSFFATYLLLKYLDTVLYALKYNGQSAILLQSYTRSVVMLRLSHI